MLGVKVTVTLQGVPATSGDTQVFGPITKSAELGPVTEAGDSVIVVPVEFPLFINRTTALALAFTSRAGKSSVLGVTVIVTGAPMPDIGIVCRLLA